MKKNFLFAFAIILAIGLSAFSVKHEKATVFTQKYFDYNAYPSENPSDLNDPAKYSLVGGTGTTQPNCMGGSHTCGVLADDNGSGRPVIATITNTFTKP